MINRSFKEFKITHKKKINQVIFSSLNVKNENFLINLIDNFLITKNSFVFESVEKGKIRGRYTIFGKDPDKIWEFNNNQAYFISSKKRKKMNVSTEIIIEKIIENFKFKIPRNLPPISSIISGYFSYDIIRYIENIPNSCINDLNLPDVILVRPVKLIIYDNLKKKIYFIFNCFKDQKITNYHKKFEYIKKEILNLKELIKFKKKNITKKKLAKKLKLNPIPKRKNF